ncbi:MAG: hypothetical protein KJ645_03570 [Planctomycetes bacterium]|nr:hypothetical protein [Planctomycetota bacterium]
MPRILSRAVLVLLLIGVISGCTGTPEAGGPAPAPNGPDSPSGPEFLQGRFKVYTMYRPQVQYRDFNGIFDISPGSARIVRSFWKERFNELTRPGHYGEFFIEFFDYASSLAQTYPVENREKEGLLDSLEMSFHTFCAAIQIADAFETFQKEQQRIYGD